MLLASFRSAEGEPSSCEKRKAPANARPDSPALRGREGPLQLDRVDTPLGWGRRRSRAFSRRPRAHWDGRPCGKKRSARAERLTSGGAEGRWERGDAGRCLGGRGGEWRHTEECFEWEVHRLTRPFRCTRRSSYLRKVDTPRVRHLNRLFRHVQARGVLCSCPAKNDSVAMTWGRRGTISETNQRIR